MILFYILIVIMPMMRHPLWTSTVGDLTMIKYLGGATVFYAAFRMLARRSGPPFLSTGQARWFFAFALWATASYILLGQDVPLGISPMMSCVSFVQLFFVTLILVDSVERLRTTLLMMVAALGYASMHVVREWQNSGFAPGYRPGWMTGDPNYYSIVALLTLPVALSLAGTLQPAWQRWLCGSCVCLGLIGVTAAASRGGFVGIVVSVIAATYYARRRGKLLASALGLLVPMMLVAPSSPLSRLLNPGRSEQIGTDSRILHWKAGMRMLRANPMTGVGAGNFQIVAPQYARANEELEHVAHNAYIQVAAELGLPGLIFFTGALVSTFNTLRHIAASGADAKLFLPKAARALQVGLIGFVASVFFISAEYQKMLWLVVFLSISLRHLAMESVQLPDVQEKSAPAPSVPPHGLMLLPRMAERGTA